MDYKSSFPFFSDQSIRSILSDIEKVLKSGVLTAGNYTLEFEQKFSNCLGIKNAVAVSSGASSLEIPLRYFGVKNKEVIVPTNTFVATPNSVIFAGGRPVFSDIKEETLCIDPEDVKRKITPKTAGIIVVHIAGLVCPQIDELLEICREHNFFLIEDCAHAHGAKIDKRFAGTLGDAGCFSFAPTKVLTTGEGGIIVTKNDDLARVAFSMRNRGLDSERLMVVLGNSWCMSEINAILGIHQIKNLNFFINRRNEIANKYDDLLKNITGISLIKTPSYIKHSYHKYPIKLHYPIDTEKFAKLLKQKFGVETGRVYYPPCHLHPYYRETFGTREGDFPVAERVQSRVLCLPIHVRLSNENILEICSSIEMLAKEF